MLRAVTAAGPNYVPPKRHFVGGADLHECKQRIEKALSPLTKSWRETGVTIASDMMQDKGGCAQMNIICTNDTGAVFVEAVDCKAVTKSGVFIASILRPIVERIEAEHVVALCTDGGSNYKDAGKLLQKEWPHLDLVPCATHVLDLLMEDIGKMDWAKVVVTQADNIISFVCGHQWTRAFMRDPELHGEEKSLQVLRPAGTRFGTQCDAHVYRCAAHVYRCDAHVYRCDAHVYRCDAHVYRCDAHVYSFDADVVRFDADGNSCDADVYRCDADVYSCDADVYRCGAVVYRCSADVYSFDADVCRCMILCIVAVVVSKGAMGMYSFGILMLVMLSGRGAIVNEIPDSEPASEPASEPGSEPGESGNQEPISISDWASGLMAGGQTSPLRDPRMEAPDGIITHLAQLAVSCTAMPTASRPSMSRVAQDLEALRGEVGGGDVRASAAARVDELLVSQRPVRSMEEDLALLEQQYADQGRTVG
ncbi:unnamed protein product [Closterium sp. Yama58-4]|nr:unnamed protein product [Closterium sp. Yama58-4]